MRRDTTAAISGVIEDQDHNGIPEAVVYVIGFGEETTLTDRKGSFRLRAHAADGQQIQVHIEKKGYRPVDQWHLAGDSSAVFVLDRR
jgi:hypothetical protein